MKFGREVGNTRSIPGEHLFFFRDHHDFGRKIVKLEMKLNEDLCFFFIGHRD